VRAPRHARPQSAWAGRGAVPRHSVSTSSQLCRGGARVRPHRWAETLARRLRRAALARAAAGRWRSAQAQLGATGSNELRFSPASGLVLNRVARVPCEVCGSSSSAHIASRTCSAERRVPAAARTGRDLGSPAQHNTARAHGAVSTRALRLPRPTATSRGPSCLSCTAPSCRHRPAALRGEHTLRGARNQSCYRRPRLTFGCAHDGKHRPRGVGHVQTNVDLRRSALRSPIGPGAGARRPPHRRRAL
jgi:hypothetical protein